MNLDKTALAGLAATEELWVSNLCKSKEVMIL